MTALRDKQSTSDAASPRPSTRDAIGSWLDVLERMLNLPRDQRRAIRAELEDHLRNRVDDLMMTGMSEPEATRVAVGELGETAELASSFRSAATVGKRMTMIQAAAIATMGGLLTLGATTFLAPNNQAGDAVGGMGTAEAKAPMVALDENPSDAFDANLRCYDVGGLIDIRTPQSHNPEAQQLVEVLSCMALNEEESPDDAPLVEPQMMIVGPTLFIRADEDFQKRAAWVLASLKQKALQQQQRDECVLAVQREREHLEHERAEKVRQNRIEELHAMYQDLTARLRRHLSEREARLETFNQELHATDDDKLAQQTLMRQYDMQNELQELEHDDLMDRIQRVRAMLMDAEYGQNSASFGASTGRVGGARGGAYGIPQDPFDVLPGIDSGGGRGVASFDTPTPAAQTIGRGGRSGPRAGGF